MNPANPKIKDFYKFIYDRQLIWHRKEVVGLPREKWTDDPILYKNKFCNAYRELDKCSIHLLDNVIYNPRLNLEDKVFNIILYRRFNTPDFYSFIRPMKIQEYDWKSCEKIMDHIKKNKINLFNSAYIICQRTFQSEYRKKDKHVQQLLLLNKIMLDWDMFYIKFLSQKTYKDAHKYLTTISLTGGFLAQQYLIDITYIAEFRNRWDINSTVDVGPGAIGAIELLYEKRKDVPYETYCKLLWSHQEKYLSRLDWKRISYKRSIAGGEYLRLSDIQNCLCEFRKYCHLQTNPNKRKRYYKGAENGH